MASIEQLLDLDVSKSTLRRARQHGVLSTILPGIVRLTGSPETFASRAMALQLHSGDDSYVSGFSAGALYGLREMPRRIVEVTVPEMQRYVMPTWGRLHRSSWIDLDARRGQPRQLATGVTAADAVPVGGRVQPVPLPASRRGLLAPPLVTPDDAATYLAAIRRQGRTGVKRFEHWLEQTSLRTRPSQSGLELDVLEAVLRAGLPEPERQFPLALRTGEVIHLDLAWPNARLGVEPGHTWWHGGNVGMERDEARRGACAEVGWLILPCTEAVRADLAAFGLRVRITHDERHHLAARRLNALLSEDSGAIRGT